MNLLETSLGKLKLQNPITVASGTFGLEYADFFDLNLMGAYVTKTITLLPKAGNPPPRLYETKAGLLNSIGLQNPGVQSFCAEQLPLLIERLKIPIIVSISGSSPDEFESLLLRLEQENGIQAYEINISCPNVENEGIAFGLDAFVVHQLTQRLSRLTQRELILKLSPNVTDITEIALAAEAGGADSLTLINTLFGMAIDWKTGKSRIRKGIAGYSGAAIKPVALAMTYKVAQKVKIPILAMGGIANWQDALEFIYAGASAIAIGTASFSNPRRVPELINDLGNYCNQADTPIKELIGKVTL
ncbi:MAG: dihydroorotate dehydrogenase [Candidatus Cloacimonetes bacterium]|nr:dihydroorotate dehydrogenase [Candidatus Cloacimonadota bacterium]